jgi:hypothetical protein
MILMAILLGQSVLLAQELETNAWCHGCPIERAKYEAVVQGFIDEVKTRQIEKVVARVAYPLRRQKPVPFVMNAQDMTNRYAVILDEDLVKRISESKPFENWGPVGYKGIMLNDGDVWLDFDGKVIAINTGSEQEIEDMKHRWAAAPAYTFETSKFRIQISKPSEGEYKYMSWSVYASPESEPDLVVHHGAFIGNQLDAGHEFHFNNGKYEYTVLATSHTKDGPVEGRFQVGLSGKLLVDQPILTPTEASKLAEESKSPNWMDFYFERQLSNNYRIDSARTPFRLDADFNKDKKMDVAFAIQEISSGKKGFVVIHQGLGKHYVMGAGTDIGNVGDDFSWVDTWEVTSSPTSLYLSNADITSAYIRWTGKKYEWIQEGIDTGPL